MLPLMMKVSIQGYELKTLIRGSFNAANGAINK